MTWVLSISILLAIICGVAIFGWIEDESSSWKEFEPAMNFMFIFTINAVVFYGVIRAIHYAVFE